MRTLKEFLSSQLKDREGKHQRPRVLQPVLKMLGTFPEMQKVEPES